MIPPIDSALRHGVSRACSSVSPNAAERMAVGGNGASLSNGDPH